MGLKNDDLFAVDSSRWSSAKQWATWWLQPKVSKMFTKSFTEMDRTDWEFCPKTTNAVEAQNKISNASHSSLLNVKTEDWYREDRRTCFKQIAAEKGIPIGQSKEKRDKKNATRRQARNKPKLIQNVDPEMENPGPSKRKKRKTANEIDGSQHHEKDPNLGRHIWVSTPLGRGISRRTEWCEAIVESMDKEGDYIAKYTEKKWKGNAVSIPDLFDDSHIRLDGPPDPDTFS